MNTEKYLFNMMLENKTIKIVDIHDVNLKEMTLFILTYTELDVISYREGVIALTDTGHEYIIKNRKNIFLKQSDKEWEHIPSEFIGKQVEINQLVAVSLKGVKHTNH